MTRIVIAAFIVVIGIVFTGHRAVEVVPVEVCTLEENLVVGSTDADLFVEARRPLQIASLGPAFHVGRRGWAQYVVLAASQVLEHITTASPPAQAPHRSAALLRPLVGIPPRRRAVDIAVVLLLHHVLITVAAVFARHERHQTFNSFSQTVQFNVRQLEGEITVAGLETEPPLNRTEPSRRRRRSFLFCNQKKIQS